MRDNILFISRKNFSDIGGLSRFSQELINRFSNHQTIFIKNPLSFLTVDYKKISLIHLCDATLFPLGILIKSIIHRPLTVTVHGLDLVFDQPVYQKMLKMTTPKAHALILDSKHLQSKIKNHIPFAVKTVSVINPGISIEHLKHPEKMALPDVKNKIILTSVGNLVKRKGHVWFIENIMTKLNDTFMYFLVGDGPEKKRIQRLISQMGLIGRVYLLGQISNQKLAYLLGKTDIFVSPNQAHQGNFEGFGLAAGEAAALGIPVVASRIDGIPEVIHDQKNGFLVNSESNEFIKIINKLKDIDLRNRIGKKSKNYTLKQFDWDKTVDKYINVFQEVIDKTPLLPWRIFPR